jgi:hypothetical protein
VFCYEVGVNLSFFSSVKSETYCVIRLRILFPKEYSRSFMEWNVLRKNLFNYIFTFWVITLFCGRQVCFCSLHLQITDSWSSSHVYGLYCRVLVRLVVWLMNLKVPEDQCQSAYRGFSILLLEGGTCKWWRSLCISNCLAPVGLHIFHILQLEHKKFPEPYAQRCKNEDSSKFEPLPRFGSFVTSPFVNLFI